MVAMGSQRVAIIDDDLTTAQQLEYMLRGAGLGTRTFTSTYEFLTQLEARAPGCVVAKLAMPGMSGFELQRQLARRESKVPVVFITAGIDVAETVRAMKSGAVSCLQEPVRVPDLIAAVREGISRDAQLRAELAARRQVSTLIESLTPREREVLDLVVTGLPNKQIAFHLGAAEKTVKVHRWRLMRKLRVRSPIHLVQLVAAAGMTPAALPRGRHSSEPDVDAYSVGQRIPEIQNI
jgi:FixJ family two-component response regulator